MSTRQILFRSSLWNASGHLLLMVASFFSLPILVSSLGTAYFGQYLLLVGIPALAGLFDLGYGNGSLYYLSHSPDQNTWRKILGSNLIATIPMVLAGGVIAYFGIGKSMVFFMASLVLFNQLSDIILMLAQSQNIYSIYNLKVIIVGIGNTLGSAYIAHSTGSLSAVILTQIVFHLLAIFGLIFWVRSMSFSFVPIFDISFAASVLRYGISTLGSSVASQLQAQTAKYYLGYVFNTSATAIYGLALSLVQKGLTLIQVTGRSFFATAANLDGKAKYTTIRRIFIASVLIILVISFFAVLGTHLFGYKILVWWLKNPSIADQVYPILKILSFWFVAVSLTPLTSYIGLGVGEAKLVSIFAISSALVEIVLMFVLTPHYGLLGPAYAALLSSYLHTPIFLYLLWQKISAKI